MNSKKELVVKPKAKSKVIVEKSKAAAKPKATKKDLVVKPKAVAKPKATKKDLVVKPKAVAKPKATKKDLVVKPKAVAKSKAVEKPKATKKASVNTLKKKGGTGTGTLWGDTKKAFSGIKEGAKELGNLANRAFSGNRNPSAILDKQSSNIGDDKVFDQQNDSDETNITLIIEIVKKAKKELNDLLKKIDQIELSTTVLNNDRETIIEICDMCKNNYLINEKKLFNYTYSYDIYLDEINLKSKIKTTSFESSNKNELKILIEIFDLSKAIYNHYSDSSLSSLFDNLNNNSASNGTMPITEETLKKDLKLSHAALIGLEEEKDENKEHNSSSFTPFISPPP